MREVKGEIVKKSPKTVLSQEGKSREQEQQARQYLYVFSFYRCMGKQGARFGEVGEKKQQVRHA
jgi:hypothetical protein